MAAAATNSHVESGNGRENENRRVPDFIRNSIEDLRGLNASTEQDFLSVGAYLHELAERASAVSKTADMVVELVMGEEIEGYAEKLRKVEAFVNGLEGYFQSKFEHLSRSLSNILSIIEAADARLSGFKTIVKHLQIVGISTRIEQGRFDDGGKFGMLSDHVEKLSVVIASKTREIFRETVLLRQAVQQSAPALLSMENVMSGRTKNIMNNINSGFSRLFETRSSSAKTAVFLNEGSREVSSNMSEVISSLQFHDITRQQIEHVIEAFEELSIESRPASGDETTEILRELGGLQIDQLNHARKEMASAVNTIVDRLQGITRCLSGIMQEIDGSVNADNQEEGSFLTDLRQSFSYILSLLNQNREMGERLAEDMHRVSSLLDRISLFVTDIEEIAIDMQVVAINAQIRAAQVTGNGAALGVLATAIRNLSDTTMIQTQEMVNAIESLRLTAQELDEQGSHDDYQAEVGFVTGEINALLDALEGSQHRLSLLLTDLKKETGELNHGVETVIKGTSAAARAEVVVSGIISNLREIIGSEGINGPRKEMKDGDRLARLAERYTMDQERSIHQTHINRTASSLNTFDSDTFAGNVELF